MLQGNFKTRFWRLFRWFLYLFVVLFVLRFIYGYFSPGNEYVAGSRDFFSSISILRRNYASEKTYHKSKMPDVQTADAQGTPDADAAPTVGEEKFEKTATISATSSEFEKDAAAIKTTTKNFNAVIQNEESTGNKGHREVHLLIGVLPQAFDSFYLAMQKFGVIQDISVTKVDKTNEYRKLNAKRVSLEKALASLNEIKASGKGDLKDIIELHDKILEIESQLQELGVSLGDFNADNEFCTVRFSLYEGVKRQAITVPQRIKVALQWTIRYYAVMVCTAVAACALIFLLLLIFDKLRLFQKIVQKIEQ